MSNSNKPRGLPDTVLLILISVLASLIFISHVCNISKEEFNEAQYHCQDRGGVKKYYFHPVANKFQCSDGKYFTIRYNKLPNIYIKFN